MTAVTAHELGQSFDCKTPGCDKESRSSRGLYAYCDACRTQRAQTNTAKPLPKPAAPVGSYAQRAKDATKALAAAGKRLDKAKTKAATAAAELRAAQAARESALRDLSGGASQS